MIESLTDEQRAKLPPYVDKWTKIALCTDRADRTATEEGIKLHYEGMGLGHPKIVWCESPYELWSEIRTLRDPLTESAVGRAIYSIPQKVLDEISELIGETLNTSIYMAWNRVAILVWQKLMESFTSDYPTTGRNKFHNFIVVGGFYMRWLAYLEYRRKELGLVEDTDKIQGISLIIQNCGWFSQFKDVCFATERPSTLKFDEEGHPHCEDGPAIAYPDGWSIYSTWRDGTGRSHARHETIGEQHDRTTNR
ncbi:MAG TPA: hypothetical protein VGK47_04500 [Nitrososphaeraceae archaeon]